MRTAQHQNDNRIEMNRPHADVEFVFVPFSRFHLFGVIVVVMRARDKSRAICFPVFFFMFHIALLRTMAMAINGTCAHFHHS